MRSPVVPMYMQRIHCCRWSAAKPESGSSSLVLTQPPTLVAAHKGNQCASRFAVTRTETPPTLFDEAHERSLEAEEARLRCTPPPDWLERASSLAATRFHVPKRREPCCVSSEPAGALVAFCGWATVLVVGQPRLLEPRFRFRRLYQRAAVNALHVHWNDWAAHYNLAVAQIQEGNWNYAVAMQLAAFCCIRHRLPIATIAPCDPAGWNDGPHPAPSVVWSLVFNDFPGYFHPGVATPGAGGQLVDSRRPHCNVLALYLPHNRRALKTGGRSALSSRPARIDRVYLELQRLRPLNQTPRHSPRGRQFESVAH